MRQVWLRSIAVIGVGLALLAAVLFAATNIDARAPRVVGYRITQPFGEEEQVALTTTSIEVSFSEQVEQASAERALRIEPEVDGAVSWSGTTMLFTPDEPLPLESSFTVTVVAGVLDQAGNEMTGDAGTFTFETTGRPQIVESEPADGAAGVALDAAITISFSTLMDTSSVEAALELAPRVGYEAQWSGQELQIVPNRPLLPNRTYELGIGAEARDVAGVEIGTAWRTSFRTISSSLEVSAIVPADGTDGIAVTSPIAVLFDAEIDPDSVTPDLLSITPEVSGSMGVEALPGADGTARTAVRFTPSGPLPQNTTFRVEFLPGVRDGSGLELAGPLEWSFTTGTPFPALSNQLTFISDRSGVANLWGMNPDGSGQRQMSAELIPILDYAVAPDGRSFILADGRRLILQTASASQRRVLTDAGLVEFDPAWAADGRSFVFARADAETGAGLGLWTRSAEGGDEREVDLPPDLLASPSPSPTASGEPAPSPLLRAPSFSPDGGALAFAAPNRVGVLELPGGRLTWIDFRAEGPPVWAPDSSTVLVPGLEVDGATDGAPPSEPEAPIPPLGIDEPATAPNGLLIGLVSRSGTTLSTTSLGDDAYAPAIGLDGRVAYLRHESRDDPGGRLYLAEGPRRLGRPVAGAEDLLISALSVGPEADALALAVLEPASGAEDGIWLIDLTTGDRSQLSADGRRPRWLP